MSPTAEQVADGTHRAAPTPFLTKTYQLVDDPSNNNVISWSCGGTAFVVLRPDDFARDLLPRRFKHNNFSSFVRQLNTYGFKKISSDRWEFAHDLFRWGEQQLLCRIERRKVTPAAPPADRTASPASSGENPAVVCSGMAELMEENEELRRENKRLASENAEMKNLCNTIRLLVSSGSPQSSGGGNGAEASPLLERMAGDGAEDGGDRPRVFGVQIGPKRTREEEEERQLMPPEVRSPSKGSVPDPQEDGDLVRLSLCQVSNRRVCNASNRYVHPAISDGCFSVNKS